MVCWRTDRVFILWVWTGNPLIVRPRRTQGPTQRRQLVYLGVNTHAHIHTHTPREPNVIRDCKRNTEYRVQDEGLNYSRYENSSSN